MSELYKRTQGTEKTIGAPPPPLPVSQLVGIQNLPNEDLYIRTK